MIGHKWHAAEGTIVDAHLEQMELPGKHGMHHVAVYDVDVRTADGAQGRSRVISDEHRALRPDTVVRLEINSKTGEVRFHPHSDQLVIRYGFGVPSTAAGAGGTAAGFFGGDVPGGTHVVIGGSQVTLGGTDATELLRSVLSGDPAARAAAKEQLRELAQSAGPGGVAGFAPAGGGSAPSASDRLVLLQQLLAAGQLSQAEYNAKRQQILDSI